MPRSAAGIRGLLGILPRSSLARGAAIGEKWQPVGLMLLIRGLKMLNAS